MKRFSSLALFSLLCLFVGGCSSLPGLGSGPKTKTFRMFIDAANGYMIKVSPDWKPLQRSRSDAAYIPFTRWWQSTDDSAVEFSITAIPPNATENDSLTLFQETYPDLPPFTSRPISVEYAQITEHAFDQEQTSFLLWQVDVDGRSFLLASRFSAIEKDEQMAIIRAVYASFYPLKTAPADKP